MITIGSCAPAPIWEILPFLSYADPCMATFSEINTSEKLNKGLETGKYQLIIVTEEPKNPQFYYEKYGEEQLFFLLPGEHPLAGRKSLSFKDFSEDTMLVYEEIGPVFITDLALKHFRFPPGKIPVTISDADAKKSYYCACLKSQKGKWMHFFDRMKNLS